MMEKYYIKKGRRYVEAGYSMPDIPDGFYFQQKTNYGSRQTSVNYWAGTNPPQPLDFQKLAAIMSNDDKLAKYIATLTKEDSPELAKAKEDQGGYVKGPLQMYNWSFQDLATCILRFLFEEMENDSNK